MLSRIAKLPIIRTWKNVVHTLLRSEDKLGLPAPNELAKGWRIAKQQRGKILKSNSFVTERVMNYPFVAFCINENGELVISHQKDPQCKDPLEVTISMSQMEEEGFDGAARSIGMVTLSLLEKWYPKHFAGHPVLRSVNRKPAE